MQDAVYRPSRVRPRTRRGQPTPNRLGETKLVVDHKNPQETVMNHLADRPL
jgi:hypothetical protein